MLKAMIWTAVVLQGIVLTGCSAQGKWSLAEVDPSAFRAQFSPHVLTLQKDGTYYAERPTGVTETGHWEWNGPITGGLLVLGGRAGESESYNASMPDNDTLILKTDIYGEPATARFKRKQ